MKKLFVTFITVLSLSTSVMAAGTTVGALMRTGTQGIDTLVRTISTRAGISASDQLLLRNSLVNIIRAFNNGSLSQISDDVLKAAFGTTDILAQDVSKVNIERFFAAYEQAARRTESLVSVTDGKLISSCFSSCMGDSLRQHTSVILKDVPASQSFRAAIGNLSGPVEGRDLLPEIQRTLTQNADFSAREARQVVSNIDPQYRRDLFNALSFFSEGSEAQKEFGREFAALPQTIKEFLLTNSEDRQLILSITSGSSQSEMDESARAATMLVRAAKENAKELQSVEDYQKGLRSFYQQNLDSNEETIRLLRQKDCFGQAKYLPVL